MCPLTGMVVFYFGEEFVREFETTDMKYVDVVYLLTEFKTKRMYDQSKNIVLIAMLTTHY